MKTLTAEQLSFFLREVKETSVYEMYYYNLTFSSPDAMLQSE